MTKSPDLYGFASIDELATHLRKYIIKEQNRAIARNDTFRVAVSGGSLPKTLAKALLAKDAKDAADRNADEEGDETRVQWGKWDIFFADERCVELDHEDSNYRLIKEELLDHIPADEPQPKIHTIDTTDLSDADATATEYHKTLVSTFAARDSVKFPCFDLLLLGCGPDGHTCSLFPDHALLAEEQAWVCGISDSPKPPARRITLSLPVVLHALKIAFVATGKGKKDLFRTLFDGGGDSSDDEGSKLPCGIVNARATGDVVWFSDKAATEDVKGLHVKSGL